MIPVLMCLVLLGCIWLIITPVFTGMHLTGNVVFIGVIYSPPAQAKIRDILLPDKMLIAIQSCIRKARFQSRSNTYNFKMITQTLLFKWCMKRVWKSETHWNEILYQDEVTSSHRPLEAKEECPWQMSLGNFCLCFLWVINSSQ